MSDFTLTPDEPLDLAETPTRQLRLIATGLAPTADVPVHSRSKPDAPPCSAPCGTCGALVLTGKTQAGAPLALDVGIRTYTVLWENGKPHPMFYESRAYPVHRCDHE